MPIFTLAGTAIAGALFGGSVLAATLIAGGLAYGASLLFQALTRPKARSYSAVQGEIQYGADVPVGTMFGTGKVKGHHIFYAKWGEGNKFNADVFLLANGWCDGLETTVYFDGEAHTLVARAVVGSETAHYGVEGYGDLVSLRFYDGRPGQTADAKLVADTSGLGQTWKSTSVCAGMAYVVLERQYDVDKFKAGRSEFEFVLRGLREYDPRKDSTVAGGLGPHRLANPATWEFSKNPVLHRLNYQLGLRGLISGRTIIGEGKSLGQLDLGSYIASMNAADAIRAGKKTYEAAIYVTGEDDHTEILKELDDAIAGYALNRRGLSGVVAGAPQIPVLDIGPDDLPVSRGQELKRRKSAFELYNYMSGQFTSIEGHWNPDSLKPVFVNLDLAADGRPRQTRNDFLQVTDPDIAQYLLNIRYRQNRKGGSATVPVSRRAGLKVQEGEWVTFEGLTWLVTGWRCDSQFRITLSLAETGADVYSEAGIEPGPIILPPALPVNPSILPTVLNFNVAVGFITGADGQEAPVLQFTWDPPNDPTIVAVRFFYFIGADPTGQTIYEDQTSNVETGNYTTSKNVAPGVHYTARATITTVPDRLKSYTPWRMTADVTGAFSFFDESVIDGIAEEVEGRVVDLANWANYNTRETIEEKRKAILLNVAGAVGDFKDRQTIRREVASSYVTSKAQWSEGILTATGPTSALSLRLEELRTEVFDPDTGLPATNEIVNLLSAEINDPGTGLVATNNSILSLTSTVGSSTASGLLKVQSVATAAGAVATAALGVTATSGGTMGNAALYLNALGDGSSEVFVVANRFAVKSSPTGTKYGIFAVDAGVVWIDEGRIRNLKAANIDVNELTASSGFFNNLTVTWANISSAVVNNFVAATANLGTAVVTTLKLADGAATAVGVDTPANVSLNGGTTQTAAVTINSVPAGSVIRLFAFVKITGGGNPNGFYYLILYRNGTEIYRHEVRTLTGSGPYYELQIDRPDIVPAANNYTYAAVVSSNYSYEPGSDMTSNFFLTTDFARR